MSPLYILTFDIKQISLDELLRLISTSADYKIQDRFVVMYLNKPIMVVGPPERYTHMEEPVTEVMDNEVKRMQTDVLRTFIQDVHAGNVFLSSYILDKNLVGSVFLPLGLGIFYEYPRRYLESIGAVWEYTDRAMPVSVNGLPIFVSCKLLHIEDMKVLMDTLSKLKQKEDEVLNEIGQNDRAARS